MQPLSPSTKRVTVKLSEVRESIQTGLTSNQSGSTTNIDFRNSTQNVSGTTQRCRLQSARVRRHQSDQSLTKNLNISQSNH